MGNMLEAYVLHPDTHPNINEPPTFDPTLGFPNGRKERVMKATREEMEAARLPFEQRDYCAHLLLEFLRCKRENFPWVAGCKHELHDYDYCQYQDFILRMKEYEREKRLKERAKRVNARQSRELLVD